MYRKSIYLISFILALSLGSSVINADPFQQEAGPDSIVSIEAENFDENTPQGAHTWEFTTDPTGFSGTGAMRSLPNNGTLINEPAQFRTQCPRLDFEVNFLQSGTHYIWVRCRQLDDDTNSSHVGINGDHNPTSDRVGNLQTFNEWVWAGTSELDGSERLTMDIPSSGVYTINVWMRESGYWFDKIVFTTSPDYTPTDEGPVESSRGPRFKAYAPSPKNDELYSDVWATLSWLPGSTAVSHDVYVGENFDDVNDGTGDTFQLNQDVTLLIIGFPTYPYPDGLVPGTTYYWRIDEIEADGTTKHKGDIWSFSIPPKTAYSPDPTDGAEFVDLNVQLSWTAGFGTRLHYIVFGEDFDEVNNAVMGVPNGTTTYRPGSLQLAKTYYWRVDEFDSIETHKGEVWSFTTLGAVSGPNPADGAVDVKPTVVLRWDAGAVAASHEVYFGADADAVANATTASPEYKGPRALGEESYDPGKLTLNSTYFWRIDEVNGVNPDSPWAGNVWSFTTGNFLAVDDFEDYDVGNNEIWWAWKDGLGYVAHDNEPAYPGNGTGSMVGDDTTGSYTEETIVHGGSQSMPFWYDNDKQGYANYSEAELTLTGQSDWTEQGVAELSLWFRGSAAFVGSFVEAPAGTYTITGSGADIWAVDGVEADEFHYAFKTLAGQGSIVARVQSVSNTNNWAKAGVMIRETLDPDSAHAMMVVTPGSGVSFQRRPGTDDASADDTTGDITAPYWVKIERDLAGNFSAYSSADGSTWQKQGVSELIQMNANVYIGLAVTAHNASATCQAIFTNVTTTGSVGPQWMNQDIGIASNDAEPFYVAVSNVAGASAIVVHDDPAAATIDTWTEWIIPLEALTDQGIVLTDVDRIAIGLGTKGNTTIPGGSGKMYIDDIRLYRPR